MDQQARTTIQRLCEKTDLRKKAELLFHILKAKTARGSGFELNNKSIALPAIASLLASEELGYADVTEKIAHAASCLGPRDFNIAVTTVRKALDSAEREKASYEVTFESLVKKYKHAQPGFMVQCMQDVEAALLLSTDLRGHLRPPNNTVTVTIYIWTLKILGMNRPGRAKEQGVHEDDYQEIVDALEIGCQNVKKDIQNRVKALRAEKQTQNTLHKKESVKKSPFKPALRDVSLSPTKTPTHKRKVTFSPSKPRKDDDSSGVEDTPSKRQKSSSPTKYANRSGIAAFQDALGEHASSSRTTLEVLQDQISDDGSIPAGGSLDDDETSKDCSQVLPPPSDHSSDASTDIPDVEMSDAFAASEAASDTDAAPATPRRSQRQTKPHRTDPPLTPSRSAHAGSPSKRGRFKAVQMYENGETGVRRRRRPVLLEHRQWTQRDNRVERELKIREQWVREMIEKRGGHPFEILRAGTIA